MPRHRSTTYVADRNGREQARRERAAAKRDRRRQRPVQEGDIDPIGTPGPERRHPSAFPAAPPEAEGISRLLSRGL